MPHFKDLIFCQWFFYMRRKPRITTWNTLYEIPIPLPQDLSWAQTSYGMSCGWYGSSLKLSWVLCSVTLLLCKIPLGQEREERA